MPQRSVAVHDDAHTVSVLSRKQCLLRALPALANPVVAVACATEGPKGEGTNDTMRAEISLYCLTLGSTHLVLGWHGILRTDTMDFS